MKFLVDNPLSKVFARNLSEAGLDVIHVRDLDLHKAPDEKIFELAQKENRIILLGALKIRQNEKRTAARDPFLFFETKNGNGSSNGSRVLSGKRYSQ